jgi:hypothetical protein
MRESAMTDPLDPRETARDELPPSARKAAFGQTFRAVAWSFMGIRRARDQEQDHKLNPVHVVIAGILGAAVFVLLLVLLVHFVIGSAVTH